MLEIHLGCCGYQSLFPYISQVFHGVGGPQSFHAPAGGHLAFTQVVNKSHCVMVRQYRTTWKTAEFLLSLSTLGFLRTEWVPIFQVSSYT